MFLLVAVIVGIIVLSILLKIVAFPIKVMFKFALYTILGIIILYSLIKTGIIMAIA